VADRRYRSRKTCQRMGWRGGSAAICASHADSRAWVVGVAYAATVTLFVLANKLTTSANTIFLQSTSPLYILLLSPWLLKESFHSRALKYGDERVATCSDCHENHDVRVATDPASSVNQANLPKTCGQCHTTNYSERIAQGLVHDREAAHSGELRWDRDGMTPAQESYYLGPFDLGFWVPLFFQILIPSVLLTLLLVVILGNVRTVLEEKRKR